MSCKQVFDKCANPDVLKKIFFGGVSLGLVLAIVFQLVIVNELGEKCQEPLTTAPLVSSITLASSFVFTGLWVFSSGNCVICDKVVPPRKTLHLVSLLLWTCVTCVGVAAAGATLGQIKLYHVACRHFKSDIDLEGLQYVSIILLILSIGIPHIYPKRKEAPKRKEVEKMITSEIPIDTRLKQRSLIFF